MPGTRYRPCLLSRWLRKEDRCSNHLSLANFSTRTNDTIGSMDETVKKVRAKWGKLHKFPEKQLLDAKKKSRSITEMLGILGLTPERINYDRFKAACALKGVDLSSLAENGKKRPRNKRSKPLDEILREKSKCHRVNVKRRLIRDGLLDEKCAICSILPMWNGEPLVLVLDHINGINDDYRIENLRLLCPNCNSQTHTFAGRNRKIFAQPKPKCFVCGRVVSRKGARCIICHGKAHRKISWPHPERLKEMVAKSNKSAVARELGVSEAVVRKRLRLADRPTVGPDSLEVKMDEFESPSAIQDKF